MQNTNKQKKFNIFFNTRCVVDITKTPQRVDTGGKVAGARHSETHYNKYHKQICQNHRKYI